MLSDFLSKYRPILLCILTLIIPLSSLVLSRRDIKQKRPKRGQPIPVARENQTPHPKRGPLDRSTMLAVGPTQATLAIGLNFVEDFWKDYIALQDLKDENEALRLEVARLREERARLIGVLQENARLRKLVQLREDRDNIQLQPARVIARDSSPFFRVLRIKLDLQNLPLPVQPRQAVISYDGVVGQVTQVYNGFADVMLLSDPKSRVDIISLRNRARGVSSGLGHKRDYAARISYLLAKDDVQESDLIVTSGKDELYPPDLLVGHVTSVDRRSTGLYQDATLEPTVDFDRLEEVFIVIPPSAMEEPTKTNPFAKPKPKP